MEEKLLIPVYAGAAQWINDMHWQARNYLLESLFHTSQEERKNLCKAPHAYIPSMVPFDVGWNLMKSKGCKQFTPSLFCALTNAAQPPPRSLTEPPLLSFRDSTRKALSLGADAVFDYKDPGRVEKIIAFAGGKIARIWDTVSILPSARTCAQVIADGGHYTALLPVKCRKLGIENSMTMGYTIMGEPVDKGWFKKDDTQTDFDFARSFVLVAENLLAAGKLKAHRARVLDTGLEGVLDGLQLLRDGKISGEKWVYLL